MRCSVRWLCICIGAFEHIDDSDAMVRVCGSGCEGFRHGPITCPAALNVVDTSEARNPMLVKQVCLMLLPYGIPVFA